MVPLLALVAKMSLRLWDRLLVAIGRSQPPLSVSRAVRVVGSPIPLSTTLVLNRDRKPSPATDQRCRALGEVLKCGEDLEALAAGFGHQRREIGERGDETAATMARPLARSADPYRTDPSLTPPQRSSRRARNRCSDR